MKFALNTKLVTLATTGVCSMSLYVMGGNKGGQGPDGGHGHGKKGNAATATAPATPTFTPPGHHYGWERGRHNPHHSASPTPGSDVSPTPGTSATPEASATPEDTATPSATPSPTP